MKKLIVRTDWRNEVRRAEALIIQMHEAFAMAANLLADGKDDDLRMLLDAMVNDVPAICATFSSMSFPGMAAFAAGYDKPSQIVPGNDDCIDFIRGETK